MKKKSTIALKFTEIDEETIIKIIDGSPLKTSSRVDKISFKQLKYIKLALSKPIALITKQTLNTGIFPHKLKIAKIIPIFKSGEESLFPNYRPMSLLPVISKIIEKVINFMHTSNNRIFCMSQHGFRTEHSTELAALELVDRTITALHNNHTPFSIFLDLSKAFDTIDHQILFYKCGHYGITNDSFKTTGK